MPLLRTSLLMSEPAGTLESLDELFALANAMEMEAANRYSALARDMKRQNKGDLAEVFAQLAAAEREHVDSVTRWSQSRRGKAPDPALVRWEAPETFDAETAKEIGTSRLTTPYRALAMAVRNEERAFAFWSYLAAYSKDSEIKQAAEAMAREELGHVATLRKERRRAYHKEHEEAGRSGTWRYGLDADRRARTGAPPCCAACRPGTRSRRGGSQPARGNFLKRRCKCPKKTEGVGKFRASLEQRTRRRSRRRWRRLSRGAESSDDQTRVVLLQGLAERGYRAAGLAPLVDDGVNVERNVHSSSCPSSLHVLRFRKCVFPQARHFTGR